MLNLLGEALNGAIDIKLLNSTKAQVGINYRKSLYHLPLVPDVMNSCFLGSLSMMALGKLKLVSKRYAGLAARTVLRLIS